MSNFDWGYPNTVWFGNGRIKDLPKACKVLGIKNPLFVTDKDLVKTKMVEETLEIMKLVKFNQSYMFKYSSRPGTKAAEYTDQIDEEIKKAEEEINILKKSAPEKINKIAIETSSELVKKLIGAEVNNSSISAIVEDISRKTKEKNHGI